MKIISTSGSFSLNSPPLEFGREYIFCDSGCNYNWESSKLKLSHYSSTLGKGKYFSFQNKTYQEVIDLKTQEKTYINVKDDEDIYKVDDAFKPFFKYGPPTDDLGEYFVGYERLNRKNKGLFLCNISANYKMKLPVDSTKGEIRKNSVFTFDKKSRALDKSNEIFTKLDFDGKPLWSCSFDFDITSSSPLILNNPIFDDKNIFLFYGSRSKENKPDKYGMKFIPKGGVLLSLDSDTGDKKWQIELENALFDIESGADQLYLLSGSNLLLVNKVNGQIETDINLKFDPYYHVSAFSNPTLFVDDSNIFISSPRDGRFVIIDKITLNIIRDIKLPVDCIVGRHSFTSALSGKYYFKMLVNLRDVHNSPVLEVDLDNIHSDIIFEEEPEHVIEMVESSEEGKEVKIEINNSTLDNVIRFGEIYAQDEAHRYSHNYIGRSLVGREFTPELEFNGIIRLRIANCTGSIDKIEEYLRTMEERFEQWNDSEGCYSCIDNTQLTRLITEIVK